MRGQEVFVLDTNVLIFAPEALEAFSDAEIVIPINVIEELDRFKAELSDGGGVPGWFLRDSMNYENSGA